VKEGRKEGPYEIRKGWGIGKEVVQGSSIGKEGLLE
jgi:hypothetical protein